MVRQAQTIGANGYYPDGTDESRLNTIFELLRQIDLLDHSAVRDRYQQFANTARDLLAGFREVEENFRNARCQPHVLTGRYCSLTAVSGSPSRPRLTMS
jgi:Protein of unknown function (DUF3375)